MRGGPFARNPIAIGALTVLVIVVAVYLSYNANQGVPFLPTYRLEAETPSAANLVVGNEVRLGGSRVGAVDSITARRRDDGTTVAVLGLSLERRVAPLPRDSTIIVRPRSALGLKYVELTRGTAREGFADGDTIPLASARPAPVELDEFLNLFDEDTRAAAQANLRGSGDALAGRGQGLNRTIGELRPLLRDIVPVARTLSAPGTGLERLVIELADAARIVAPVAETQARLFAALDATFAGLRRVARPHLQDSISGAPAALDAGIREFPRQRPLLARAEGLLRALRPGARALREGAPDLAGAVVGGTPTLRRAPPFNERLASLIAAVRDVAEDPLARAGVRRLTETAGALRPTLDYAAPAQTRCNYLALLFRNAASVLSEGDGRGTWQRFIIIPTPQGPNNEGTQASAPADGPTQANHLHTNPYPNTAAPGQPVECEAGNEPFALGQTVIGNPAGTQSATTEPTR
jgi:ABC-type transporter Mla subunit MlaD